MLDSFGVAEMQSDNVQSLFKAEGLAPTFSVVNTYARNLVGDVLTDLLSLITTFRRQVLQPWEGRYGVQKKDESTIDEITGVSSLQFRIKLSH